MVVPDVPTDEFPPLVRVFNRIDSPELVHAKVVGVEGSEIAVQYSYETLISGKQLVRKIYPASACCVVPSAQVTSSSASPTCSAPKGTRIIFFHPEHQRWTHGRIVRHHPAPGVVDPARPPKFNSELNNIVSVWQGDITQLKVDGIQNAANEGLRSGGGICGAIFSAAGEFDLQRACYRLHPLVEGGDPDSWGGQRCMVGETKITPGCGLHAKHVLHTVGPRGEKPALLAAAYRSALDSAVSAGMESVALCCISTGIFGYPPHAAAPLAVATVRTWLEEQRGTGTGSDEMKNSTTGVGSLRRIIFCLFLDSDVELYQHWMAQWFPRS